MPEGSPGGDTAEVEQAVPIATLWLDECVRPSDPRPLRLLPAGASVAGWDFHPLRERALHGALRYSG